MKDMVKYLNVDGSKMNYKGVKSVPAKVVNLSELNPDITVDSLTEALEKSFGEVYGLPVKEIHSSDIPETALEERIRFFSSWDWRYGAAHEFSTKVEGRYHWGFLKLYFQVDHGIIQEASVDSDGLEADFIAAMPGVLKGKRFEGNELSGAVLAMETAGNEEETVQKDAAALLEDL